MCTTTLRAVVLPVMLASRGMCATRREYVEMRRDEIVVALATLGIIVSLLHV